MSFGGCDQNARDLTVRQARGLRVLTRLEARGGGDVDVPVD